MLPSWSIRFGTGNLSVTLPNSKEFNQDWMIILQAPLTAIRGWRKSNVLSWLNQQQNRSYSKEVSWYIKSICSLPGDGKAVITDDSVLRFNAYSNVSAGDQYVSLQQSFLRLYGNTYNAPYSIVRIDQGTRLFGWLGL